MTASRYTAEISLEDVNSAHSLAILEVAPGSSVLDIGAADGSVARGLLERGCRIVGVEADPAAAAAAGQVCERMVAADVETVDLASELDQQQFDFVLLLDVLEHLRDPLRILKVAADRLRSDGRLILSVPNVTHAALRLQLLAGRFQYTETGLLDRTHLHLFDRPALERLIEQAGLRVLDRMRVTAGLTETEIPIDRGAFPAETVELAMAGPDAETYQFVYVVTAEPQGHDSSRQPSLGETLQQRALEADQMRSEAEGHGRALEARIAELASAQQASAEREAVAREHIAKVERELELRSNELERLREEIQCAQMNIEVKDAQLVHLQSELAPMRHRLDRLEEVLGYTRHRLVDRASAVLKRMPALHRLAKRIADRIART